METSAQVGRGERRRKGSSAGYSDDMRSRGGLLYRSGKGGEFSLG